MVSQSTIASIHSLTNQGYHLYVVVWIRSSWCNQIPDGQYEFMVGDSATRAGVTLKSSYYYDDGCVFDVDELSSTRLIKLKVCECTVPLPEFHLANASAWVLDVCLDYFSTQNPFYLELKEILSSEGFDENDIVHINEFYQNLSYRLESTPLSSKERRKCRDDMTVEVNRTLEKEFVNRVELSDLMKKYLDNKAPVGSKNHLVSSVCDILCRLSIRSRKQLIEIGHLVNLPHNVTSEDDINAAIDELKLFLLRQHESGPPAAITIARSSRDDYTPSSQVDFIQTAVLKMIAEVYSQKRIVIHDICDDAYEMCYSMFVRKDVIRRISGGFKRKHSL